MHVDVAIVGGGPAGLAVAIESARRGLSTVVLEARRGLLDKACGEGILPAGVQALDALGVLSRLGSRDAVALRSIRWIDRTGVSMEATLPDGGGLGVRRTALVEALRARAIEEGAILREGARVVGHVRSRDEVVIRTSVDEEIRARVLVAADGLRSPLRRAEALDARTCGRRRFGQRCHFAIAPWSSSVEVHLGDGVEAYVTPVGPSSVGVAFLFGAEGTTRATEDDAAPRAFDALLARFPAIGERVAGARRETRALGAGPLARAARRRVLDRFVLVGDAAGYVDAITGEGLSLAFRGAAALGAVLPDAIRAGATAGSLAAYDRIAKDHFRKYAWVTGAVLGLAGLGRARATIISALARAPRLLDATVAWATR